MSDSCPTVKIEAESESGYSIINEADFDKKVHKLYKAPAKKPAKKAAK